MKKEKAVDQTDRNLDQISQEIKARIQAHADKYNITFEEAAKKAKLVIDGVVIQAYTVSKEENNE